MGDRLATIDMGRKLGSSVPIWGGELGLHLTQCRFNWAEAYLHAKFHLDPSSRLATVHQRYTQGREIGQTKV